jgi:predicted nucleic acid-binding protein
MSFVIDASVALTWCLADESDTAAAADRALSLLESEGALVPAIWPFEVANGLRSAERRGRLDELETLQAARLLRALPIRVEEVPLGRALDGILPLARALGLSAYDAAYVEMALRMDAPLATVDDQLARATLAAGGRLLQ